MLKKVKQPKKKNASPVQSEFSKKWEQIEKKQKRNKALQKKIMKFYSQFQIEILPEEENLCESIAQETRHLISFLPRKSFTKWQREELQAWIEENLETLAQHPFCPSELNVALSEEYTEALLDKMPKFDSDHEFEAYEIAHMRNLVEEIFADPNYFTDQQLHDFLRDPMSFHRQAEDFLNAQQDKMDDDFAEDEMEQRFFEDLEDDFINSKHFQDNANVHNNKQKKLKDLFNASQLKKCYKILASRLHPDKELDPTLKAQKSELMIQLVQAKKDKDAFTIISMFQQYVPDNDLNLDDDLNAELLTLLTEKLAQLDSDHRELQRASSVESMVWQKLGGRTKKVMESKKQDHLDLLLAKQAAVQHCIDSTKTMKPLNKILSQRYDERHSNPFANPFTDISALKDLFDGDFDIFSDDDF